MKRIALFIFALFLSHACRAQGFTNIGSVLQLDNGYSLGEYGGGVSFVDFDQDGLDDLTIPTGWGSSILFYRNTGNGFEEMPALVDDFSEVKQVMWVDYDNDGNLDLYASSSGINRLYKNTGGLEFIDITENTGFNDPVAQSFCGVWLDYDEDGFLDLCISFRISHLIGHIKLYRNLGNDEFQDVTALAGLSNLGNSVLAMTSFDMNNDGWEDIYVGQDYQAGNLMLKNNGDGSFENISASSNTNVQNNSMSTTIGDYNGDGWMDIYVTNTAQGNSLFENQGDESFVEKSILLDLAVHKFCWGAVFLDADNDMDLDLHVSNTSRSYMYENQGADVPFVEVNDTWGFAGDNNYSVGSALGDYDGDGRVDFAENNSSPDAHSFWQNNFTENNYIAIDLQGTVSNVMAVGAVIDVYAGGVHQIRRVGCGEGFSSQNSYTQYFGLGDNTSIEEIFVKWPNGLETTLQDVEVNQRIDILEGIIPLSGCTDPLACNYDSLAVDNDGTCSYPDLYYDCDGVCLNDADMDGVCDELEIAGCMDISACNYDSLATDDSGTCSYAELYYDCNGVCLNDADMDGVCDELEIAGCMDISACNYDSLATDDSGTCSYAELYYDCNGACLNDADMDGVCDELEIAGCMDISACNYDSLATDDNGTCDYLQDYTISGALSSEAFIQLSYTYPETAGSEYVWKISGGEIISGQGTPSIELIWNVGGIDTLIVRETKLSDCETSDTIFVEVITVSVAFLEKYNIKIYPNPVQDILFVELGDWSGQNVWIEFYDVHGKKILQRNTRDAQFSVDLQTISNGVYQMVLRREEARLLHKVIVNR